VVDLLSAVKAETVLALVVTVVVVTVVVVTVVDMIRAVLLPLDAIALRFLLLLSTNHLIA
jgi:uncharacterized membrane protein YeiH